MISQLGAPQLHVEGPDDQHSIIHIARAHGVDYDNKPWPTEYPKINVAGGCDAVLAVMNVAIRAATSKSVGFVLDANSNISARWNAVRSKLAEADVVAPPSPLPEGFVGTSTKFNSRVGVWLMPDNKRDGALEHMLLDLINPEDPLLKLAISATTNAIASGAKFPSQSVSKAQLHTWLSWQEEPGQPYGVALRCKYFDLDKDAARRFMAWFKSLFGLRT